MDFRSLLQSMTSLSEATKETGKGRVHTAEPGGYGRKDDEDADGNPVKSASTEKRGRGRPKKDADSSGEVKSYDTKSLGNVFGGGKAPKKAIGTVSKKHSLKEYIDSLQSHSLTESQIEEAVSRKDFRMVADLIKNIEDPQKRAELAQHHAQIFQQQNPRFSPDKFYAAVGVDPRLSEEEITIKPMPGASQIVGADGETLGTADAQTANTLKQAAAKGTLSLGGQKMAEAKKAKPDFLDVDKDKNKKESFKKAVKDKEDKKKVDESISFNEMSQDTQTEAQEMLAELQDDIENFVTTGHCSDKLEAFLKVHGHSKKKITDEGSIETHTQHGMDAMPSKLVGVPAKQAPTPWKVDPIQATTDRAGSFIKSLVAPKKTFESKTMKDIQLEGWESQLNGLLTEGITVSSSQGQQGQPDSVTVSASDADAQQLLQVLRQAGIGAFGGEQPTSNYGAPMNATEPDGYGTEPESAPEVAGDGDDMMALIKKMTGIQDSGAAGQEQPGTLEPAQGGDEGGQDYEDEEGSEEDSGEEEVTDEGNDGNLANNAQPYDKVTQGDVVAGRLGKDEEGGEDEHEHDETCESCGQASCECDSEEDKVEEGYANEPDEEMMKLKALLSMGNDMHRQKQSQAVGNPTKVTMETKLMQQSTSLISDWKKLSGIK